MGDNTNTPFKSSCPQFHLLMSLDNSPAGRSSYLSFHEGAALLLLCPVHLGLLLVLLELEKVVVRPDFPGKKWGSNRDVLEGADQGKLDEVQPAYHVLVLRV